MSKLQASRLTNTSALRHNVIVKLPLPDEQQIVREEEITVVYRGRSLRELDEMEAKYSGREDGEALAEVLAENIIALPDIMDGENPVEPTVEFFLTMDTFVLNRINKAIREDRTANPTS